MNSTDLVGMASLFAYELHKDQHRKGSGAPFITHLWAVASLVGEHGGSDEEIAAALLHDAGEDQGGECILSEIRNRFGNNVAETVAGCSDTLENPKPSWEIRKEKYLNHLSQASSSVLLVSCADKVHNARTIVIDLTLIGDDVWNRFKGGKDGSLWYYQSLLKIYLHRGEHTHLVKQYQELVDQMATLCNT